MRIRLKVIAPGGESRVFEHQGPTVCIGRDPSCELVLHNDEGVASSRQHARIDLTPTGAVLVDLGSANKTQHNEQVVERPARLDTGDRIQIGYTGAQLVVLDLDLAPAAPPVKAGVDRRVWLMAAAGVAPFVLVGVVVLMTQRGEKKPEKEPIAEAKDGDKSKKGDNEPKNDGKEQKKDDKPIVPPVNNESPAPNLDKVKIPERNLIVAKTKARTDIHPVGNYLRPKNTRPSVLLHRYSEDLPWSALRDGEAVSSGHTLVSLPGYESVVALQSGVRLNLWGGLPQLDDGAPVGESVIQLQTADSGIDADLILDRGRVEFGNQKDKGAAVVRVNFVNEQWDFTLKDKNSRVLAELIYRLAPGTPEDVRVIGVFTQGDVAVKTAKKEFHFAMPARLAWRSDRPQTEVFEEKLKEAPPWWKNKPELNEAMKQTLLLLGDWADKRFHASKAEPEVVFTMLSSARDPTKDQKDRELGLWFLAAIDEPGSLVEFLRDQDQVEASIRTTALFCLQDWLRRNGQLKEVFARKLSQRFGYPTGVASQLVRLMAPIPEAERAKAATYQELIDLLDHDDVGLRHVAFWQLYQGLIDRRPGEATRIKYDPVGSKEERQAAAAEWRRLIPPGTVPPKR